MLGLLQFVPVATSLILGVVFLIAEDRRLALRLSGAAIFSVAVYLQFFSLHGLAGMLLQIALALGLVFWRKAKAT